MKERFALPEPQVVPFLRGEYTLEQHVRAMRAKNKSEEEMIQAGIDARETSRNKVRSEQQRVDPYEAFNANDPVNW